MTEFNNRIAAQRQILLAVNSKAGWREELYGMSSSALDRWARANGVDKQCRLMDLLVNAASALFFLANKSQEQLTDEYRLRSIEVSRMTDEIRRELLARG